MPEKVVASLGLSDMDTSDQHLFAANDTEIEILGRVTLPMRLLGRQILTDALVSPNIDEIMLGSDWLHDHNCLWDLKRGCIHVDGGPAIELSRQKGFRCRRVFVQQDTMLPPRQQVNVLGRTTVLQRCVRV